MHLDPISREKLVRDFQSSLLTIVLMSTGWLIELPADQHQNSGHRIGSNELLDRGQKPASGVFPLVTANVAHGSKPVMLRPSGTFLLSTQDRTSARQ